MSGYTMPAHAQARNSPVGWKVSLKGSRSMKISKSTPFRQWAQEMWRLNSEERETWHQPRFTFSEYIREHQSWLRLQWRRRYDPK